MKYLSLFALVLFVNSAVIAQQKISVEEIYTGAFRTKGMDDLQSLKNTNQYTVLNFDRASRSQQIALYEFSTLKKITTLLDTKDFSELKNGIDSYTFSSDEKDFNCQQFTTNF